MPSPAFFDASWQRCWSGLQARGDGAALKQALLAAWAEPQRSYHTQQHLSECLALFDAHRHLAVEPAEVEVALWFHDAIYAVRASDNEARSADWAEAELRRACVPEPRIARVRSHVLATRHSALPEGSDQALLVDIDLSILGAPRARFEEYERQVREEYRWVPGFLFQLKRKQILAQFLARDAIFNTPAIRDALEAAARENLADSLRKA
jgi:predicted metal-dependent HD superfamily phosphohydrolase